MMVVWQCTCWGEEVVGRRPHRHKFHHSQVLMTDLIMTVKNKTQNFTENRNLYKFIWCVLIKPWMLTHEGPEKQNENHFIGQVLRTKSNFKVGENWTFLAYTIKCDITVLNDINQFYCRYMCKIIIIWR